MTRANIEIIQKYFPKKAYLVINSDGYPSGVIPPLVEFLLEHINKGAIYRKEDSILFDSIDSTALQNLLAKTYATIGAVGNFSYAYRVDLVKGTITVWESGTRWINAPKNWEERGWNCWKGSNGKYGYTTWVKSKRIFEITLKELLKRKQFKVEKEIIKIKVPTE